MCKTNSEDLLIDPGITFTGLPCAYFHGLPQHLFNEESTRLELLAR